jgi:hypothetical protein
VLGRSRPLRALLPWNAVRKTCSRRAAAWAIFGSPRLTRHNSSALRVEMTYVTDTHALVVFASGSAARMSRKCVQIFGRDEQQRDRVHIPIVCFFELAMLLGRGRVKSSLSFDDWHDRLV